MKHVKENQVWFYEQKNLLLLVSDVFAMGDFSWTWIIEKEGESSLMPTRHFEGMHYIGEL